MVVRRTLAEGGVKCEQWFSLSLSLRAKLDYGVFFSSVFRSVFLILAYSSTALTFVVCNFFFFFVGSLRSFGRPKVKRIDFS